MRWEVERGPVRRIIDARTETLSVDVASGSHGDEQFSALVASERGASPPWMLWLLIMLCLSLTTEVVRPRTAPIRLFLLRLHPKTLEDQRFRVARRHASLQFLLHEFKSIASVNQSGELYERHKFCTLTDRLICRYDFASSFEYTLTSCILWSSCSLRARYETDSLLIIRRYTQYKAPGTLTHRHAGCKVLALEGRLRDRRDQ